MITKIQMKIKQFPLFVFITLCFACKTEQNVSVINTPEDKKLPTGNELKAQDLAKKNNAFALDIFKKMAGSENLFISPFSISTALSMAYTGAAAETEAEMAKTMHWPENSEALHKTFGQLIGDITKDAEAKEFTINIANRIYTDKGFELFRQFSDLNSNAYKASVQSIDFGKSEEAVKTINNWVSEKTEKMIPSLLKPSSLEGAKLVLVNAVYFYGGWSIPFEEKNTKKDSFWVAPNKAVETSFMQNNWRVNEEKFPFKYNENEQFQALELPYSENKGSMVILLPRADSTGVYKALPELVAGLNVVNLESLLSGLTSRPMVDMMIPKWKQKSSANLVGVFQGLGMKMPFIGQADFSRMSASNLSIGAIIHEAVVDVSEKGTKAAASTAVVSKATSAMIEPEDIVRFYANRPFIYIIRDQKTGSILFMGQMMQP